MDGEEYLLSAPAALAACVGGRVAAVPHVDELRNAGIPCDAVGDAAAIDY